MAGTGFGSAVDTVVKYLYETDFVNGTDSTGDITDKCFGGDQQITSLIMRNNLEKLWQYNNRRFWKAVPKQFEGLASFEFTLSNPWWLLGLFGKITTSGSSAPFTHQFDMVNRAGSMQVQIKLRLLDEDKTVTLSGVIITSATISAAVNELVKVRMDCLFRKAAVGTQAVTAVTPDFEPYVFQHGSFEIPDGTSAGTVQRFELTINNNTVLQYGLGSRYAVRPIQRAFDVTGRLTMAMEDTSYLSKVLAVGTDSSFSLDFGTGTDKTAATFSGIELIGSDIWWDEHSPSLVTNEPIIEDLPVLVDGLQGFATDKYGSTEKVPDGDNFLR